MKFKNVRLLVGDMAASIQFWRDVMGLHMTYGDEAMGYAYFETAWGVRSAHLSDPNGYIVELYSELPRADAPTV